MESPSYVHQSGPRCPLSYSTPFHPFDPTQTPELTIDNSFNTCQVLYETCNKVDRRVGYVTMIRQKAWQIQRTFCKLVVKQFRAVFWWVGGAVDFKRSSTSHNWFSVKIYLKLLV